MATPRTADAAPAERFAPFAVSVTECTARLPRLVSLCGRDRDAFKRTVDTVDALETRCDETGADAVDALAGPLEPAFDPVYLRNADLLTLVRRYDEVATLAERFAKELEAVAPDLPDPVRTRLRQAARMTHDAAAVLERTVRSFVAALAAGRDPDIDVAVERIHRLEGECDEVKYDCIAAAFEGSKPADALVYKDLATGLDDVINAIEDTADHLVYVASKSV